MSPLDETLRASAAAVSGRSGARQGGQAAGEPGAFENAVADAGRQRQQGQGPGAGEGAGNTDAGSPQEGSAIVSRGSGSLLARDVVEAGTRLAELATQHGASRDQSSPDAIGSRQKAMARLQQLTGGSIPGEREAAGQEEHALTAKGKGPTRHAPGDISAAGGTNGDEVLDSDTGATEPASGTVSDLLTLLGGPTPVAANAQAEGKAALASDGRRAAGLSAKVGVGASADVGPDGEPPAVSHPEDAGADRLFRFARADGKGQAVAMNISGDGERVVVENGGSSAASRAEAVTVLEARRYLGVTVNTNSASVASAIAGDGDWAQALQSTLALTQPEALGQAGKTLNTLKIQMHPIDLGTVTATLRLKDDELHIDLKVETGEAYRQLRDDQSEMVRALRAQGFAVDQVNVTLSAGGDSSSGNGSQTQAGLGQSGRERTGEGSGEGRQRQDGSQGAAAERWTGNDGTDDASTGAERARAGHVYM